MKEQLDTLALKKVGSGAGDTTDTIALKAEIQRLEHVVEHQEKVIGDYERVWTDVGSSGTAVAANGGADRLRALILSYKRDKEQLTTHFDDLKARFQRFATEVEAERESNRHHADSLNQALHSVDLPALTAERNKFKAELTASKDELDTKTSETNSLKLQIAKLTKAYDGQKTIVAGLEQRVVHARAAADELRHNYDAEISGLTESLAEARTACDTERKEKAELKKHLDETLQKARDLFTR